MKDKHKLITRMQIAIAIAVSLLMAGCGEQFYQPGTGTNRIVEEQADTTSENIGSLNTDNSEQQEESGLADSDIGIGDTQSSIPSADTDGSISITMLDVGQGMSLLIEQDGHYMLYDGGSRKASSYVVAYLQQHDITSLDYMVASHYDEDHIAGLVGVLNTTAVKKALTPDYTVDSKIYQSFISALEDSGETVQHPIAGDGYAFGNANFQVVSPGSFTYEGDNNNSIAIRIVFGDFSCIITGDAEEEAEADMLSSGLALQSDLYVVGHHGSSSSSSEAFLDAVQPEYAFISVGADNKYGHPTKKTLSKLQERGIQMFRSDKQGEVTCTSDGKTIWFSKDACTDWTPGTYESTDTGNSAAASSISTAAEKAQEYVLNTHTLKFHKPDCASVQDMNPTNREDVTTTREDLIKQGYSPCGNCNP